MKHFLFALSLLFAFTASSCNDECQTRLDEIQTARVSYQKAPTEANCLNYKAQLERYLNGSCKAASDGINYDVLFQDYLDNLPCN